jgi:pimeloyl-ACP methyl ester carboxylesterase
MQRLSNGSLVCGLLVGLLLTGLPQLSRAADAERVKFDTVDQVEIHGTFYPSAKGQRAPCALMLHALGGSSEQDGWADLAKKLQEKGFAVLTFDFRGHGESVNVGPGFWMVPNNRSLKSYRLSKPREQISYKDFTTIYNWAGLVDDIGAAKHFLDKKNDAGECNSSNVAVIGAEGGAALGAMWICDAYKRRRAVNVFAPGAAARPQAEGQDITCAVWLSISQNIGVATRYNVPVESWLRSPVREKVPMYFLYGEQDTRAANTSKHLCDGVLRGDRSKLKLTGWKAIKGTKLAGRELLGKSDLNTDTQVLDYVTKVVDDRGTSPYVKRNAEGTYLVPIPVQAYLGNR